MHPDQEALELDFVTQTLDDTMARVAFSEHRARVQGLRRPVRLGGLPRPHPRPHRRQPRHRRCRPAGGPLLLLDEPFGALDAQTKRSMQEFLRTLWQRTRATILMVTHDVQEAVYLADRIYVMTPRPGRVAEVVDVPFGAARGPSVKRDPRFLDLVDEIEDLLHTPQNDTAEPEEQADVA